MRESSSYEHVAAPILPGTVLGWRILSSEAQPGPCAAPGQSWPPLLDTYFKALGEAAW